MQQNKHDKGGKCLAVGLEAERQLALVAEKKKVSIRKSSRHDDMCEHFDYHFDFKDKSKKVEIKAMKRLSRKGEPQDEWIWVEFKNVRGKKGWLYGSADLISFEFKEYFLFVDRQELVQISESLINITDIVKKPELAKYKVYHRWNRPNELVGMINASDLKKVKNKMYWRKIEKV